MTIDYVVKKKAIDLHLQGRGRNEIARILNGQKMRISEATITHLIQDWKRQQQQHQQQQEQVTTTIEPSLQGSQSPPQSPQQTFQPELLQEQKAPAPQQTSPIQDIDFADNPYPESDVYTDPNVDYYEQFDGGFNYQYTNPYSNTTFPNNFNQQVSRPHVIEEEESENSLGIDWDSSATHQTRFVRWVMYEKKRRQEGERKLQEQWAILVQEKNNLEEQKRNLEVREAKLHEVKDLIPSAKELKQIGIDFSQANSWLSCVKEMSEKKGLDLRTASWELAEDLLLWQDLGGLRKAIQQQKQQLNLLGLACEQQKDAIAIIADLKKSGMTTEDISNLVKTVSKWSDQSQGSNGSSFELDNKLNLQGTPQHM